MRVLLLNPPGPVLKAGTRWSSKIKERGLRYNPFPFFQGYAAAVLRENGHEVAVLDCVTLEKDRKDLYRYIDQFKPDLIAMETTITSYGYDLETSKQVDCPIVIIGMHATSAPEMCLKDYNYVCIGEYEYSLLELVNYLEGNGKFPVGVVSKEHPQVTRRPLIGNLDDLPWPARDLMPIEKYNEPIAKGFNVVLVSSRGCPWHCSFCQVLTFYGKSNFRTRSSANVVDEMEFLWNEYKPDELYFDDDSFSASPKHVKGICNEIIERGLDIQWGCMGLANISIELLELMAKAGCKLFKFGVEAIDPEVLAKIPKPITKEHVERIVKACKKYGIRSHPTFMVGLPGSTKEKDLEMIKFAMRLHPSTLQFSVATPFPGTKFYEEAEKNGWLITNNWDDFGGTSVVISYPDYDEGEIEKNFALGWKTWNRHILIHQPHTIWHHLSGVYRREGLLRTLQIIKLGLKNVIFG